MPDANPTDNAAEIAAIKQELLSVTAEQRRVNEDIRIKDGNVWATINNQSEKFNQSRHTNWQLIIGAMTLIITIVILWSKMSTSPIEQRLVDHETRIGTTWGAQGKTSEQMRLDEIAQAYRNGQQDERNLWQGRVQAK